MVLKKLLFAIILGTTFATELQYEMASPALAHSHGGGSDLISEIRVDNINLIPASEFRLITPKQFKALEPFAISRMSFEQLDQLNSAAKLEMTKEQASIFPKATTHALISPNIRHPCEAVVLGKDSFRSPVLEILKRRCSAYFKKDAEIVFSSQIMASMFILSLIFLITS